MPSLSSFPANEHGTYFIEKKFCRTSRNCVCVYVMPDGCGAIACTWSKKIPTMKILGDPTYSRLGALFERVWSGVKSNYPFILSWVDYRDEVLITFHLNPASSLKTERMLAATMRQTRGES